VRADRQRGLSDGHAGRSQRARQPRRKAGRRIVAEQGDVRDFERLRAAIANGVDELGRIDFVLANAGILPACGEQMFEIGAYVDSVDVMLNGVYYTIEAALPAILEHGQGGAIVITSSTAGLNGLCPQFSLLNHGLAGYQAAKHGVVGLMRYYATALAEKSIRVNTVHPTGVATPMLLNEPIDQLFKDRPEALPALQNLLPVELIDAADISEAMVYRAVSPVDTSPVSRCLSTPGSVSGSNGQLI
jgi:NAD(P)-dependent dehydrogenase (short-subunit alcohol dehydrogenase family)